MTNLLTIKVRVKLRPNNMLGKKGFMEAMEMTVVAMLAAAVEMAAPVVEMASALGPVRALAETPSSSSLFLALPIS
jgi:hypothetical protein